VSTFSFIINVLLHTLQLNSVSYPEIPDNDEEQEIASKVRLEQRQDGSINPWRLPLHPRAGDAQLQRTQAPPRA
jgi:hypothetical protein